MEYQKIINPLGNTSDKVPTIPHINSETNPPLPMINVVCRYLRCCFDVATLPISCNLSREKGPDLSLQSGPFQNFHTSFQELTWSQ